ncbi:MAG TPA: hypothetical protein VN805_14860 [Caulobacteraceae bacterium]|nr:hypothetical protein [Caulobacteraceae bacterium]
MKAVAPFALTRTLTPALERVLEHWETLKRGANDIPFGDDMKIASLPALADRLLLLDVFVKPERFRIDYLGDALAGDGHDAAPGRFIDEVRPGRPFEYLRAQASATVERGAPTLHRAEASADGPAYTRLLAPLWGDGHISMLLGAIADG